MDVGRLPSPPPAALGRRLPPPTSPSAHSAAAGDCRLCRLRGNRPRSRRPTRGPLRCTVRCGRRRVGRHAPPPPLPTRPPQWPRRRGPRTGGRGASRGGGSERGPRGRTFLGSSRGAPGATVVSPPRRWRTAERQSGRGDGGGERGVRGGNQGKRSGCRDVSAPDATATLSRRRARGGTAAASSPRRQGHGGPTPGGGREGRGEQRAEQCGGHNAPQAAHPDGARSRWRVTRLTSPAGRQSAALLAWGPRGRPREGVSFILRSSARRAGEGGSRRGWGVCVVTTANA